MLQNLNTTVQSELDQILESFAENERMVLSCGTAGRCFVPLCRLGALGAAPSWR